MNHKANPPYPFNIIACRVGRPFTLVQWMDHKGTEIHKQRLGSLKQSGLEELELNGTINRFEHGSLNQLRKKQKTIQFFPKAPRPLATKVTAKGTCDATDSMTTRTCEDIIRAYRLDTSLQKKINACVQYCAILSSMTYVAGTGLWNELSQVFAQFCTPNKVTYQKHVKVFQCSKCCDAL
jgi:hypothetical protein